ncbi:MAG: hypothetical protein ACXVWF_10725 [Actinomycetota bacterium]
MRKLTIAGTAALGVYAAATYLGATWGSTGDERRRVLASDDLVEDPTIVTNHAITIDARAEDVWPWLVQVGWHRGGWYTYRWVDRVLFPANDPAAEEILPEFQGLRVGDHIPDGPPESGCHFVVEALERPSRMVLRSRTHLPPFPRDRWLNWVWTYTLEDLGDGRVRVLLRTRGAMGPPALAFAYRAAIWTDFVMARSHLRGLKARVEGPSLDRSTTTGAPISAGGAGHETSGPSRRGPVHGRLIAGARRVPPRGEGDVSPSTRPRRAAGRSS